MKKKKLLYCIIIFSLLIIVLGIILLIHYSKMNTTKQIGDKNGFQIFSTDYVKVDNKNTNIVIWYGKKGDIKTEHSVKKDSVVTINKFGFHDVKVKKITDNNITISMSGLAPTKKNGTFSMTDKYDNITIDKNTGIKLNIQATDLYEGFVYLFYIKK